MTRQRLFFAVAAILLLLVPWSLGTDDKRPTAEADDATPGACSGVRVASSAMANFHDSGGEATSSVQSATQFYKQRRFTTWAEASGGYSALSLKVRTAFDSTPDVPVGDAHGEATVQYSINGGAAWTTIRSARADWAAVTDSVSLSAGQNLSQLQVRVCVMGVEDSGENGTGTLTGYDIRTEGTLSGGGVGPRRSAIISEVRRPTLEAR